MRIKHCFLKTIIFVLGMMMGFVQITAGFHSSGAKTCGQPYLSYRLLWPGFFSSKFQATSTPITSLNFRKTQMTNCQNPVVFLVWLLNDGAQYLTWVKQFLLMRAWWSGRLAFRLFQSNKPTIYGIKSYNLADMKSNWHRHLSRCFQNSEENCDRATHS